MSLREIKDLLREMKVQKQRWLGTNHPDSKVRKEALRISGVEIGKDVFISLGMVVLDGYERNIKIGDRVAFGNYVSLVSASGPNNSLLQYHPYVKENLIKTAPIIIGEDSWIGSGTTILPGITIGEKSIVGANSLVNKDVQPYSIIAGSPARLIRTLEKEEKDGKKQ